MGALALWRMRPVTFSSQSCRDRETSERGAADMEAEDGRHVEQLVSLWKCSDCRNLPCDLAKARNSRSSVEVSRESLVR